jgi:hypothetical protein
MRMTELIAAVGLLSLVPALCCGGGSEEKGVWGLKKEVAECERKLTWSQRELAEARARLALAEGKRDLAITALRQAVVCCDSEVQWVRDHANWFCDPREMMTQAQWDSAKAHAWLAEVEGDTASLVQECKKIVGFHEQHLQTVRRLEKLGVVKPVEVCVAQEALEKARGRLQDAEKRLAAEQAKKPKGSR